MTCGIPTYRSCSPRGISVKVVSEGARHASAFVTLTTYAHTMPGMQQEAVDRLDAALRPHLQG